MSHLALCPPKINRKVSCGSVVKRLWTHQQGEAAHWEGAQWRTDFSSTEEGERGRLQPVSPGMSPTFHGGSGHWASDFSSSIPKVGIRKAPPFRVSMSVAWFRVRTQSLFAILMVIELLHKLEVLGILWASNSTLIIQEIIQKYTGIYPQECLLQSNL